MELYLMWAIAGFGLIIAELLTGTFYLLVLGVAALVAAAIAWLGGGFWVQCMLAGSAALLGTWCVHKWAPGRADDRPETSNDLDRGQTVVLESWIDQGAGLARVQYRGASWDAKLADAARIGDILYIHGRADGRLLVAAGRPD